MQSSIRGRNRSDTENSDYDKECRKNTNGRLAWYGDDKAFPLLIACMLALTYTFKAVPMPPMIITIGNEKGMDLE